MKELVLKSEYIKLGQALKAADLVSDGAKAKMVIQNGKVEVNGITDTRRGRKLQAGDVVLYNGSELKIIGQDG
ncbi:MAG TPA: RNA-binding protein [Lachnospiraceae bacterium]|nr:RNA-binding protein [Lachnospiraceae bacterium]